MYEERSYCANCGHHNPQTSHWHVGNKCFCSQRCYYTYQNISEDLVRGPAMNGHHLPAMPVNPGVWGRSPKHR